MVAFFLSRVAGTGPNGDSPKRKEVPMQETATVLSLTVLLAILFIDRLVK